MKQHTIILLILVAICSYSYANDAKTQRRNKKTAKFIELMNHENENIRNYSSYWLEEEYGKKLPQVIKAYHTRKAKESFAQLRSQDPYTSSKAEEYLVREGHRNLRLFARALQNKDWKTIYLCLDIIERMESRSLPLEGRVDALLDHHSPQVRQKALRTFRVMAYYKQK